jgi:hypothetical protein
MAGLLQFALGLTTGNFLSAASRAQGALGGVIRSGLGLPGIGAALAAPIAAFASLHGFVDGVFSAIEKGSALQDLSKRTGESVRDLFLLQKGFINVGLSAEAVGPLLFRMQKALGGVNEFGEPTKDIFAKLGLSTEDLKKKSAPAALADISKALAGLSRADASVAGGKIFGRGGAADILQLARSSEEFTDALAKAGPVAEIFARNAERFDKVSKSLIELKAKAQGFFVGVAEGLAPAIQGALDQLNSIDLVGPGRTVGRVFEAAFQSGKIGNFSEVMGIALSAAFERALNYLGQGMFALAAATPGLFAALAEGGKAVGTGLQKAMAAIKLETMTNEVLKLEKAGQENSEHYRLALQMGRAASEELDRLEGKSSEYLRKAFVAAAEATAKGFEAAKKTPELFGTEAQEALKSALSDLPKVPKQSEPEPESATQDVQNFASAAARAGKEIKTETDALTRIGFFSTTAGAGGDYPRQTATHTSRMSTLLEKHTDLLTRIAEGGAAPAAAHT